MNFKIQHLTNYPNSLPPSPSLTFIPYLNSIIIYGHQKTAQSQQDKDKPQKKTFKFSKNNDKSPSIDKINLYNILNNEWKIKQAQGKIPSSRQNHSIIYLHPCLLLFGGKSHANPPKSLNDLYALNTQTWIWKKLFSLQGPPASQNNHIAKVNQTKMILVGKQIWTLSIKDVNWQLNANELPGAVWQKINVSLNEIVLGIAVKNEQQILIFYESGIVNCLNLNQKKMIEQNAFQLESLKNSKKTDFYATFNQNNQNFLTISNESINSYGLYKKEEFSQIQLLDQQLIKQFKISSIDHNQNSMYILTKTCQIYHIDCSQLKAQRKNYNDSPNCTSKNLINSSCIKEQSHESSAYYSKQNDNQDFSQQDDTQRRQIQFNQSGSRIINNLQENYNNQENQQNQDNNEENNFYQSDQQLSNMQENRIKQQLGTLLAYQHFKRKLLETKSRVLEQAIKRSQKMVLTLCKYGNQKDKRKHIQKVKVLRQQLEHVWGKQSYYRKQIENRKSEIPMRQLLQQNLSSAYSDFFN